MTTEIDLIQDKNLSVYYRMHSCFRNFGENHVLEKEEKRKISSLSASFNWTNDFYHKNVGFGYL